MKLKDLTGKRFGRLVVIKRSDDRGTEIKKRVFWLCKCDCGNEKAIGSDPLISGRTNSCGCLAKESIRDRSIKHGHKINRKSSREYKSWQHAKSRCFSESNPKYHRYGGRGITMCDRWKNSFENFFNDMGTAPEGCTIDRMDNDGNYEPGNCRWATAKEQGNNTSACLSIEWRGGKRTLSGIARIEKINYKSLHSLITYKGFSLNEAVSQLKNKA